MFCNGSSLRDIKSLKGGGKDFEMTITNINVRQGVLMSTYT